MEAFSNYIAEYRKQLQKGAVQAAYRGLIEYITGLRTHLSNKYPDYSVSGGIYQGTMDMTYFSFTLEPIKNRNLKIAVVFVYDRFRFEAWLGGVNRQVQSEYWKLLNDSGWDRYRIVPPGKGIDSILENVLVKDPDFIDLDSITERIETGTLKFIADVENFLSRH